MLQRVELPNETLEQTDHNAFLPDDIDNFPRCCKQFYVLLATKIPKHKEMKRRYLSASCDRIVSGHLDFPHPIHLLGLLFQDPGIAMYIKTLKIWCCSSARHVLEEAENIASDLRKELQPTVNFFLFLIAEEKEAWF